MTETFLFVRLSEGEVYRNVVWHIWHICIYIVSDSTSIGGSMHTVGCRHCVLLCLSSCGLLTGKHSLYMAYMYMVCIWQWMVLVVDLLICQMTIMDLISHQEARVSTYTESLNKPITLL